MDGQYYIVRCYKAGVFFGQIKSRQGDEIEMLNVRKIWYWSGAAAVEQLAMEGVKNPGACKFTMEVPSMLVMEAVQIIPCTELAVESIRSVTAWKM